MRQSVIAISSVLLAASVAWAEPGYLGVYLTEDEGDVGGAVVQEVEEESPASLAGIEQGDVVVRCDGESLRNSSAFIAVLVGAEAGRTLRLEIKRGAWRRVVPVTLAPRSEAPAEALDEPAQPRRPRGFLGVYFTQNGIGQAVVDGVLEGSPADTAGLRRGDVVVALDGERVRDPSRAIEVLGGKAPGEALRVEVRRGGEALELVATLGSRRPEGAATPPAAAPSEPSPVPSGGPAYLGVTLDDAGGAGPLRVDDVQANGPAERFGVEPGDVIRSLDGVEVGTIPSFVEALERHAAGDQITLVVEREGWLNQVRVTLGARTE